MQAAPPEKQDNPCGGLTTPAALTGKVLDLRKQYGRTTDKTGQCYEQVLAPFTRAARRGTVSASYFRQLVLLAGAFLEDDGESEIVNDLAKIIHNSGGDLKKEFETTLADVNGICTRHALKMSVKEALCELEHPGKGSGQDVSEDRRCLALAPASFWDGIEACYQKNGS